MIKMMREERGGKGRKEKKEYASHAFLPKRRMPCIIGGENEHNLILSMRKGEMQGKGKSITRQKWRRKEGRRNVFPPARKSVIRRCV